MNHVLSILFSFTSVIALGQIKEGAISYTGRVTHMYDGEGYQIEIPYEKQNTKDVVAEIYFDSINNKLDLMATFAYTQTVIHQKEKGWVLSHERFGSERTVQTTTYDEMKVFDFDSLEFNYDTTKLIAGYSCNVAYYKLAGIPYEVWFCKDIDVGSNLLPVPDEVPGAYMEFTFQLDIADVKYMATAVDLNAPNPMRFEMKIQGGYELEDEPLFPVEQPPAFEVKKRERTSTEIPPPPPQIHE